MTLRLNSEQQTPHRSASAAHAHRSGKVDRSIDLGSFPAVALAHRKDRITVLSAWSLVLVALTIWGYDIARVALR